MREHAELETRLAQDETVIQELTNRVEEMNAQLLERRKEQVATENQKEKLSKSIKRQREELSRTQTVFEQRVREVSQALSQQSIHIAGLGDDLREIDKRILAEESKRISVTSLPESLQAQPRADAQPPGPTPPPSPLASGPH